MNYLLTVVSTTKTMEITFKTMTGVMKVCPIAEDTVVTYKTLLKLAHSELNYSPKEYRLQVYNTGEEDNLTPFSVINAAAEMFVLPVELSPEKTKELNTFIGSNSYGIRNNLDTTYETFRQLLTGGVDVNNIYAYFDYRLLYHIRFLILLISHGFDVNRLTITKELTDNIQRLLLSSGFDVQYHIDKCLQKPANQSHNAIRMLLTNSIFLESAISGGGISCNSRIGYNGSPIFYDIKYAEKIKYKDQIDCSILSSMGDTLLSEVMCMSCRCIVEYIKLFPTIDINLQYYNRKYNSAVDGDTLLHIVCRDEQLTISKIRLLLNHGAILLQNDNIDTPIDVLMNNEKETICRRDKCVNLIKTHFDM